MKHVVRLAKLALAAAIILVLVRSLDLGAALEALKHASPAWVAAAVALNGAGIVFSAFRWHRLARILAPDIRYPDAIRFYWIGSFFSTVLPSSIGGDAVRTALARKSGSVEAILTSVVMERATGLLMVMVIGAVGLLIFPGADQRIPMYHLLLVVLIAAAVLGPVMLFAGAGWLDRRIGSMSGSKPVVTVILAKLAMVARSTLAYRRSLPVLLETCGLSLVFYLLVFMMQAAFIMAVGGNVSPMGVLVAAPVVLLVSALPISINGIGVSEGAFVLFYAQVGVDPDAAFAAAILRRIVITLVASFGAFFWIRQK
ncbi:MAG: lysylphosphatidylglycerol synthase transmembrane domain-containing protein [Geminicoccaceae bacterium]